jgi:hypothetical protein
MALLMMVVFKLGGKSDAQALFSPKPLTKILSQEMKKFPVAISHLPSYR